MKQCKITWVGGCFVAEILDAQGATLMSRKYAATGRLAALAWLEQQFNPWTGLPEVTK